MPALVPAGFTRGAIICLGQITSAVTEARLLQRFWNEAGAYGSRVLIVACAQTASTEAERIGAMLRAWESESVETLVLERRARAFETDGPAAVARATGVLMLGTSALRLASLLGGTPLAQAIRRANAQNKVVCGEGSAASVLCQHMIAFDNRSQSPRPLVHRNLVQFAPGLGIINRLVLDAPEMADGEVHAPLSRLLAATAFNPFLVGVHLEPDTGVVIYPNTIMEVFGDNSALVVDGAGLQHSSLPDALPGQAVSLLGMRLHILAVGCTFNFDSREVAGPQEGDLNLRSEAVKAAF